MKYDLDDLQRRIEAKRKKFLGSIALAAVFDVAAVVAALFVPENKFIVPAAIIILISWAFVGGLVRKYAPSILFSREIEGENVKEHEYYAGIDGKPIRRRFANLPHNYSNTSPAKRSAIRGIVYLRDKDGEIHRIGGLSATLMDLYEDGDILYKPSGAKYPQIISRTPKHQPCPLCGCLNSTESRARGSISLSECTSCRLTIIYKK
jgi:hypothetical protein